MDNDKICPKCGGLVWRYGILGNKPFKCVRCRQKYSAAEILNNELQQIADDPKTNPEIKKVLKRG